MTVQRRGYLIRFIDLGLIILFGFLMISDLTLTSQIALPGREDVQAPAAADGVVSLTVAVDAEGLYAVEDQAGDESLYSDISAEEELEFVLKTLSDQYNAAGESLRITIIPSGDASMQRLVDILDVCDRLGLPRYIDAEAVVAALNEGL